MTTEVEIYLYLHYNPLAKRSDILPSLSKQVSDRTLMRMLSEATAKGCGVLKNIDGSEGLRL